MKGVFSRLTDIGLAVVVLFLEFFVHLLWLVLPLSALERFLQDVFTASKKTDPNLERDFVELVRQAGYDVQEHFVRTDDGYILGLHRIRARNTNSERRGVVFLMHGFLMTSECWVSNGTRDQSKSLPYILADANYDVWLGNNRGNKYSYKHLHYSPNDVPFWDFCLDDLALYDIPSMLQYVLTQTRASRISYIGFSQGSGQAFAALGINSDLASKVNLFVALAPCTTVNGLHNRIARSLTISRPQLVFLLFGRKALLPESLFWRKTLSSPLLVYTIDKAMNLLFGWTVKNIDPQDKPVIYSHLYSYGSVKALVHWFQITRTKRFQMFDDSLARGNIGNGYKSYIIPSYQPHLIDCPVALFHGGKDNLPDIAFLKRELPPSTFCHLEPTYEHLDFLFAKDVHKVIYPQVLDALNQL